jgi:hypothetical protein
MLEVVQYGGDQNMKCQLCGTEHEFKCHLIKAYEYYPECDQHGHAIVKRVEFVTIADFQKQPELLSLPAHATRQ